ALGARLIVLKEFPSSYRGTLACFSHKGFTRIPSMPLTRLNVAYRSFDEYMNSALNSATRSKLRKKFKAAAGDVPIELSAMTLGLTSTRFTRCTSMSIDVQSCISKG